MKNIFLPSKTILQQLKFGFCAGPQQNSTLSTCIKQELDAINTADKGQKVQEWFTQHNWSIKSDNSQFEFSKSIDAYNISIQTTLNHHCRSIQQSDHDFPIEYNIIINKQPSTQYLSLKVQQNPNNQQPTINDINFLTKQEEKTKPISYGKTEVHELSPNFLQAIHFFLVQLSITPQALQHFSHYLHQQTTTFYAQWLKQLHSLL